VSSAFETGGRLDPFPSPPTALLTCSFSVSRSVGAGGISERRCTRLFNYNLSLGRLFPTGKHRLHPHVIFHLSRLIKANTGGLV
jgi:hypothetical protein